MQELQVFFIIIFLKKHLENPGLISQAKVCESADGP